VENLLQLNQSINQSLLTVSERTQTEVYAKQKP